MKDENRQEVLVPRVWLEGLLSQAERIKNCQEDHKKYEISALLGYINSANNILECRD